MSLTTTQYQQIMHQYDLLRQSHYRKEQARRAEVYEKIPEIQEIDQKIAHISVERAKYRIRHQGKDQGTSLKEEIYDLSMQKIDYLVRHGYPAYYLDPIYTCKDCQDTGYIGTKKCHCFIDREKELFLEDSNLKEQLKEINFNTFHLDYYSAEPCQDGRPSPRDNMRAILRECQDFIQNFQTKPGQNLLINGSTGVGKTFLSICIAGKIIDQGHSVIYMSSQELFERLADYTFRREKEEEVLTDDIINADLLIIDDLGTEMNNAFINSQLFQCVNDRMIRKKSVIINTNLSLEAITKRYTGRVTSRLIETYNPLNIYGEDIRMKKALMN